MISIHIYYRMSDEVDRLMLCNPVISAKRHVRSVDDSSQEIRKQS